MSHLREQLQSIYDQHGKLTPKILVEEARDEQSPLHARFEWDDSVAGEKYREGQAQQLIKSVTITRITSDGSKVDVRAFHALRQEAGEYTPTEEIASDPIMTKILLAQMRREWAAFKARYEAFDAFWKLVQADFPEEKSA